jgi:hypothetical protein
VSPPSGKPRSALAWTWKSSRASRIIPTAALGDAAAFRRRRLLSRQLRAAERFQCQRWLVEAGVLQALVHSDPNLACPAVATVRTIASIVPPPRGVRSRWRLSRRRVCRRRATALPRAPSSARRRFGRLPLAGSAFSNPARSALLPGTGSSHADTRRSRGRSCPTPVAVGGASDVVIVTPSNRGRQRRPGSGRPLRR